MVNDSRARTSNFNGEMVEVFNEAEVLNMIDEFDILGDDVYSSLNSMDSLVAENVQVASGAIAGQVGGILFTQWNDNCVPLLNFTRFFDGISESMRKIYNRSSETADAIDAIYNQDNPKSALSMGAKAGSGFSPRIASGGNTSKKDKEGVAKV